MFRQLFASMDWKRLASLAGAGLCLGGAHVFPPAAAALVPLAAWLGGWTMPHPSDVLTQAPKVKS